jgi:hypothetical protein
MVRSELGRERLVDSGKARVLGRQPRPTEQTIVDTATVLAGPSRLGGGAGQA